MAPPKPVAGNTQHKIFTSFTKLHVFLYRLTGGAVGGTMSGAPILLLEMIGHKSGKKRTIPLIHLETDRGHAIVASYGGADAHPAWYKNLKANPEVTIQVKSERKQVRADDASPERKAELWPRLVEIYADYDLYKKRTDREIPVVEMVPR